MIEWILSSSILILVVILIRQVFRKKLRPWIRYSLWALVLVRLLIPFSFGNANFSTGTIVEEVKQQPGIQSISDRLSTPDISYEQAFDQAVQDFLHSGQTVTPEQTIPDYTAPNYVPQTPLELHTQEILEKNTTAFRLEAFLLWVWIGGMAVVGFTFLVSNLKFRNYLKKHRKLWDTHASGHKIYTCEGLDTPCLFGILKPSIYLLPEDAENEPKAQHILCHELTHHQHKDHIWAVLRCLCLTLHWYNPLVWVAAALSRRDGELACDDATIRKLGEEQRRSYGITLLEMTCTKHPGAGLMNTATTMNGSKSALKERVTMIVRRPKLSIIAFIVVLLVSLIAVGCTFSGTKQSVNPQNTPSTSLESDNNSTTQTSHPSQGNAKPHYTEPQVTNPTTADPNAVFTPTLPNMADADFESIKSYDLKSMENTMEENRLLGFFLQPYYDRPEDFPLTFAQYPVGEILSSKEQFQAMVEASNGELGASPDYSNYVNKVWIISGDHLRNSIHRYLGISMEQLNTPDTVYNVTIYSEETDSYYCILNEYAHTEHIYEIWDGYLHKNDAAILQLFERANGTYRTAVMYAKGDQWCFYANRPFLNTYPTHPKDPNDAVQTPMVVYQGIRYEFSQEYTIGWLDTGLTDVTEAATVVIENNQSIPTQELHAAQLSEGTKLYSISDNGLTLYAVRPDGRVYRLERAAEYAPTLVKEPLAYFQKLFRDDRWMNLIGIQDFQYPSEFPISYLCATSLPNSEPITQEERNYLEALWGRKIETEIQRMPADILKDAVQKYLGHNLDQIPADKLPAYNPNTNCYYGNYNGAEGLLETFTVTSVTVKNDTIQVVIKIADYWINTATLQITEDGYRFISVVSA